MGDWKIIDNTATVEGDDLVLSLDGEEWQVHTGPTLLMSSEAHTSEDALAEIALARVANAKRVLVGGLGMGFTLRATLDRLPADAAVVLGETSRDLVRWNSTYLQHLAGNPLGDPRVDLRIGDVGNLIANACDEYDVILLDVDNGPDALVHSFNCGLYTHEGSRAALRALKPGGVLAVWSRWPDESYSERLRDVGFQTTNVTIQVHENDGAAHTIFLSSKPVTASAEG